jgi:hypothetical protein
MMTESNISEALPRPDWPGWSCLQECFPGDARRALAAAQHLSVRVRDTFGMRMALYPGTQWVQRKQIGPIRNMLAAWTAGIEEAQQARGEWVSAHLLGILAGLDARYFAARLGLHVTGPAPGEPSEFFIRVADVPAVFAAAHAVEGDGIKQPFRFDPGHCFYTINRFRREGLVGLTFVQATHHARHGRRNR